MCHFIKSRSNETKFIVLKNITQKLKSKFLFYKILSTNFVKIYNLGKNTVYLIYTFCMYNIFKISMTNYVLYDVL